MNDDLKVLNIKYNLNALHRLYKGARLDDATNIVKHDLDPMAHGISLQKYVSAMGFDPNKNSKHIFYRGNLIDGVSQEGLNGLYQADPRTKNGINQNTNGSQNTPYHNFVVGFEDNGLLFLGLNRFMDINAASNVDLPYKFNAMNFFIPASEIENIDVIKDGEMAALVNLNTDNGNIGLDLRTNFAGRTSKKQAFAQKLAYYQNNQHPVNGTIAGNLNDLESDPTWAELDIHIANFLKKLGYSNNLDTICRIAFKGLQKSSGNNKLLSNLKSRKHRGKKLNDLLSTQDNGLLVLGTQLFNGHYFFTGHDLFMPTKSIKAGLVDHEHEVLKHRRIVLQSDDYLIMIRENGTESDDYSLLDYEDDDEFSPESLHHLEHGQDSMTKFTENMCKPVTFLYLLEFYAKQAKQYDTTDDTNEEN